MVYSFVSKDVNDCRQWLTMFGFNIVEVKSSSESWMRISGHPGAIAKDPNNLSQWKAVYANGL